MSSGQYKEYDPEPGLDGRNGHEASERVGLLSGSQHALPVLDKDHINDGHRLATGSGAYTPRYALKYLVASFAGGIAACLAVQLSLFGTGCYSFRERTGSGGASTDKVDVYAPPWVGSTVVNNYPPPSPTNDFPELFPTKYVFLRSRVPFLEHSFLVFLSRYNSVGYPGNTPTGAEPAIIATAPTQPLQTGAAELVAPAYTSLPHPPSKSSTPSERPFNIFRSWGNLSPWYSVPRGAFGIDEGAEPPAGCDIKGLHLLHRHGARYPTAWGMC